MKADPERNVHPFAPVFDSASRVLIVGTFPSVISRRRNFYYGNPRNRFYQVLAALFHAPVPGGVEAKKQFLLDHHIAVFDVLESCVIRGSSDASIREACPNDFSPIFNGAEIACTFANGRTAQQLCERYVTPAVYLPSTSPANASYSLERLIDAWSVIVPYLEG
ncbi:MAG: DNA-deoxyinosine glycosylase [Clostridia bacterium]|nr:DNA-deoxyinosine glycosylase [Clostridia bacterium]